MKLKLPLRLLAALVTSFAGVTVGTVTITALAGIAVTVSLSPALGADITFDGTQITVPSGGSVTYDAGNVTASTTLQFSGAGTATITNLNGDAADAVLRVNRVASGAASLSSLILNGPGTFNGVISMYSNTTGGTRNNILELNHALAAQNATIRLGLSLIHI